MAETPPSTAPASYYPSLIPLEQHAGNPPLQLKRMVALVGADKRCHLHLLSSSISKHHALIVVAEDGAYVRDLGSRTHVIVNDRELRFALLRDGDRVKMGRFAFKFSARGVKFKPPVSALPGRVQMDGGRPAVPIEDGVMLIGRNATCDIRLQEESVSTRHAVIFQAAGRYYIRDLNSRTGTYLNGQSIHQEEIHFGDHIRIGDSNLELQPAHAAVAMPPKPTRSKTAVGIPAIAPATTSTIVPETTAPRKATTAPVQVAPPTPAKPPTPIPMPRVSPSDSIPPEPVARAPVPLAPVPVAPVPVAPAPPVRPATPIPLEPVSTDEPEISSADTASAMPAITLEPEENAAPTKTEPTAKTKQPETAPQPVVLEPIAEELAPEIEIAPAEAEEPVAEEHSAEEPELPELLTEQTEPESEAVAHQPEHAAPASEDDFDLDFASLGLDGDDAGHAPVEAENAAKPESLAAELLGLDGVDAEHGESEVAAAETDESDLQDVLPLLHEIAGEPPLEESTEAPSEPVAMSDSAIAMQLEPTDEEKAAATARAEAADEIPGFEPHLATAASEAAEAPIETPAAEPVAEIALETAAATALGAETTPGVAGEEIAAAGIAAAGSAGAVDDLLDLASSLESRRAAKESDGSDEEAPSKIRRTQVRRKPPGAAEEADEEKAAEPAAEIAPAPEVAEPIAAEPVEPEIAPEPEPAEIELSGPLADSAKATAEEVAEPHEEDSLDLAAAHDEPIDLDFGDVNLSFDEPGDQPSDAASPSAVEPAKDLEPDLNFGELELQAPAEPRGTLFIGEEVAASSHDSEIFEATISHDDAAEAPIFPTTEAKQQPISGLNFKPEDFPAEPPAAAQVAFAKTPISLEKSPSTSPEAKKSAAKAPVAEVVEAAPEAPDELLDLDAALSDAPSGGAATDEPKIDAAEMGDTVFTRSVEEFTSQTTGPLVEEDTEIAAKASDAETPIAPVPATPKTRGKVAEIAAEATIGAAGLAAAATTAAAASTVAAVAKTAAAAAAATAAGQAAHLAAGAIASEPTDHSIPHAGPGIESVEGLANFGVAAMNVENHLGGMPIDLLSDRSGNAPPPKAKPGAKARRGPFANEPVNPLADDAPGAGGKEPPARGRVATVFDGLAMSPVRQADVFSEMPQAPMNDAVFGGAKLSRADDYGVPDTDPATANTDFSEDTFWDRTDEDDEQLQGTAGDAAGAEAADSTEAQDSSDEGQDYSGEFPATEASAEHPVDEIGGTAVAAHMFGEQAAGEEEVEYASAVGDENPAEEPVDRSAGEEAALLAGFAPEDASAADAMGRDVPEPVGAAGGGLFSRLTRGLRKLIPMLMLTMLISMAAAMAAIWYLIPPRAHTTATLTFLNFNWVPNTADGNDFEANQTRMLQSDSMRQTAANILAQQSPGTPPGFLSDLPRFIPVASSIELSQDRVYGKPQTYLKLSFDGTDANSDRKRGMAVLAALLEANQPDLDTNRRIRDDADRARAAVDDLSQKVDQLTARIADLQRAGGHGPSDEEMRALGSEKQRLQVLKFQTEDAVDADRAVLDHLQSQVQAAGPANQPDSAAAPDPQLAQMHQQLTDLTSAMNQQHAQQTAGVIAARLQLEQSVKDFNDQLAGAGDVLNSSSQLKQFVDSARTSQEQARQLIQMLIVDGEDLEKQLEDTRRDVEELIQTRQQQKWANDTQLAALQENLDGAQHRYNAAVGQGIADAGVLTPLQKEIDNWTAQIKTRQAELGVDPNEIKVEEGLNELISSLKNKLDREKQQIDVVLDPLEKQFQDLDPVVSSLPEAQQNLARQIHLRLGAMNDARRQYADAIGDGTATPSTRATDLQKQIDDLQARLDRRQMDLAKQMKQAQSEQLAKSLANAQTVLESDKSRLATVTESYNAARVKFDELMGQRQAAMLAQAQTLEVQDQLASVTAQRAVAIDDRDHKQALADASYDIQPIKDSDVVVTSPNDPRMQFSLYAIAGLAVVFAGLTLIVAHHGHHDDHHVPLAQRNSIEPPDSLYADPAHPAYASRFDEGEDDHPALSL